MWMGEGHVCALFRRGSRSGRLAGYRSVVRAAEKVAVSRKFADPSTHRSVWAARNGWGRRSARMISVDIAGFVFAILAAIGKRYCANPWCRYV